MQPKHIEIELRYIVLDIDLLNTFIETCQLVDQKRDVDVYFDTKELILFKKGIFIRTRNDKKVEIKFNRACVENPELEKQDYCEEYSFKLPFCLKEQQLFEDIIASLDLQKSKHFGFDEFLHINNLEPHYVIDKVRTTYKKNDFLIAVDEIKDLGTFLEIECMASNIQDLLAIKERMQKVVASVSLKPLKTGYGTLLLRTKNFQEYLLGRYVLPEDKYLKNKE